MSLFPFPIPSFDTVDKSKSCCERTSPMATHRQACLYSVKRNATSAMQTKVIYLIPTNAMLFYNTRHFSKMLHFSCQEWENISNPCNITESKPFEMFVCFFYLSHSYVIRLQVFIGEVVASGSNSEVSSTAWLLQQFFMVIWTFSKTVLLFLHLTAIHFESILLQLLYYTNFSINFLLYSTCGATFRHCLCRLIRDKTDAMRRSVMGIRYRCSGSNQQQYP